MAYPMKLLEQVLRRRLLQDSVTTSTSMLPSYNKNHDNQDLDLSLEKSNLPYKGPQDRDQDRNQKLLEHSFFFS